MCVTDKTSDMGKIAEENGFGYFAQSDKVENFLMVLDKFAVQENNKIMGQKGYEYFIQNYSTEITYEIINKHFKEN